MFLFKDKELFEMVEEFLSNCYTLTILDFDHLDESDEYKLYTLIVHPETIPDYFYQFKYDVSRRLKNLNRHIDTALNASLGEYKT